MLKDFLPTGIGFGAFDPAFRVFEPDSSLSPLYLNHAHNDLVELALTGGIAALLMFALFLLMCLKRGFRLFARGSGSSQEGKYRKARRHLDPAHPGCQRRRLPAARAANVGRLHHRLCLAGRPAGCGCQIAARGGPCVAD